MTEKTTGEITFTHVGNNPATGEKYGLVTIKVTDNEDLDFKISESTKYDELKVGELVTITYDNSEETDPPTATKILNANNQ